MRKTAVAGSFYAGSTEALRQQIEWCFTHSLGPGQLPQVKEGSRNIRGLVSPHAGYVYSGPVAAHGFSQVASDGKPEIVIIISPNHHGIGAPVAVSKENKWQTPLGEIEVATKIAEQIVSTSRWAEWDDLAHQWEHAVEVQLPFLQYLYGSDFRIIPITMLRQDFSVSQDLAQAIATTLKDKNGLIIASSDFTHYEPQATAEKNDGLALEAILNLDSKRLAETVSSHDITMCGPGPVMTMLIATQQLGAQKADLLRYATSGNITGNYSQVVGYASVVIRL